MNREDRVQFEKLIDRKLAPILKRLETIEKGMVTKQVVKDIIVTKNDTGLSTFFKGELTTTKKEIAETMKIGFSEMVKYVKQVLRHTENQEERITDLEEILDINHKN